MTARTQPSYRQRLALAVGSLRSRLLFATPVVGLGLATAMLASLRWRWGGLAVRLGAVAIVLGVSLYVFGKQMIDDLPADFGWPQNFDAAHWVAMGAVLLLGVEVAAALLRRHAERDR